ncbi:MAG: putative DNA binding domain-containing protein [Gemmatimonadota bacterium]|nr:putative DNA binding domain-containing protein [Gemmatimonadota bacterium]
MNLQSLSALIALGEDLTTEFKRAMLSDLGREICAFANATGGVIMLGVSDAGEIVGVADHNQLKSRVQSTVRSADPPISVEVESVGEVLCVVVPPQERKPYSFGGRFFIRDGANSQQMSNEEVENLFYAVGRLHFDKKPCEIFSMESDLDDETWARFSERAKIPAAMERLVALRNLGLVDVQDRMTYAGAWLLARDIRRFTITAHVSCALFMGTEKVRILDRRDFHSDIPTMIDEVVAWILTKINVEYIIKHVRRQERPELPEEALREAVANAVAHRDYRSTANVQIYVFKDRIEIVSPGGLPAGMEEADLGTKSVPRNPLLFGMLYRMDVVENIGSGIRRIRELCQEHKVPEPVIDASEHWVTTTFKRPVVEFEIKSETSQVRDTSRTTAQVLDTDRTSTPKVISDSTLQRIAANLEDLTTQVTAQVTAQVVWHCRVPRTAREIMTLLGLKHPKTFRTNYLQPLLNAEWLEMTIPDKPRSGKQQYRLTDKGQALRDRLTQT